MQKGKAKQQPVGHTYIKARGRYNSAATHGNSVGDYVQFVDFPINGEMVHHYCFNRQNVTNIFWILLRETQSISVKMIKQLLPIWFAKDTSSQTKTDCL